MEPEPIVEETDDAPVEDADETPEEKVHEPPKDHPRFNEIYGKMKNYERELATERESRQALADHNQSLQEAMDKVEDKVFATDRPDPTDEPEAYDAWILAKAEKKKPKVVPPAKPQNEFQEQIDGVRDIYDDYDEVLNWISPKIDKDQELKDKVWPKKNPALAAYTLGKKMMKAEKQRASDIDKGVVEGDSPAPPTTGKRKLSDSEKSTAKKLGIPEDKYLNQVIYIEGRK